MTRLSTTLRRLRHWIGFPLPARHTWMEEMERRSMLAAPTFAMPLLDNYITPAATKTMVLGIDGADTDGDILSITASSNDADLVVSVPAGNRYARLHFVKSDGTPFKDTNNNVYDDIVIQLFDNNAAALPAIHRFITLATQHINDDGTITSVGDPFYTDVPVHRVIPGFMIQTGDAANGNGTGGSPLDGFDDQTLDSALSFAAPGVLAMANANNPPDTVNTSDSQWFITQVPTPHLNGKHIIFGQLISGWDLYNQIINLPRNTSDRPNEVPKLSSVEILADSPQDATVFITPNANWDGSADVTITLNDGSSGPVVKTIHLKDIGTFNSAEGLRPTLAAITTQNIPAGQAVEYSIVSADDNNTPRQYWATVGQGLLPVSIDQANSKLIFTPPADFYGSVTVTIYALEENYGGSFVQSNGDLRVSTTGVFNIVPAGQPDIAAQVSLASSSGIATHSAIRGNRMYVAAGAAGVIAYDITDPSNPVKKATFDTDGVAGHVYLNPAGNILYVADQAGGLVTLDVSNIGSGSATTSNGIVKKDDIKVSPAAGFPAGQAVGAAFDFDNNLAYVTQYNRGLQIVNISDPANLTQVGLTGDDLFVPTRNGLSPPYAFEVALYNDTKNSRKYAYVSDLRGQVLIINVTTPAQPRLAWTRFTPGRSPSVLGIKILGNTIYVTDQSYGMMAYSLFNPVRPEEIGRIRLTNTPTYLETTGSTAMVAVNDGYEIIDISNPRRMTKKIHITSPSGDSGLPAIGTGGDDNEQLISLPLGSTGVFLLKDTGGSTSTLITAATGPQTVYDQSNRKVKITLTGPGTLNATTTGGLWGNTFVSLASTVNTTIASSINIAVVDNNGRASDTPFASSDGPVVSITGDLKSFNAPNVDLAGDFAVSGFVSNLRLADLSGDYTLSLGPTSGSSASTIRFTTVIDFSITTEAPIASFLVNYWRDNGGVTDTLQAPRIDKLTALGYYQGDLNITGDGVAESANALGLASVRGLLSNAIWNITGNVGTVTLGGMHGSTIALGMVDSSIIPVTNTPPVTAFPAGDFRLSRLTVSSIPLSTPAEGFATSKVMARYLGTITIKNVDFDNSENLFGFASDTLDSLTVQLPNFTKIVNKDDPTTFVIDGNKFVVRIL